MSEVNKRAVLGWLLLTAGLLQPAAGCDRLWRYEAALGRQDSRLAPGGDTGHPAADGARADAASDANSPSTETGPRADAVADLASVVDLKDAKVVSWPDISATDLAPPDALPSLDDQVRRDKLKPPPDSRLGGDRAAQAVDAGK